MQVAGGGAALAAVEESPPDLDVTRLHGFGLLGAPRQPAYVNDPRVPPRGARQRGSAHVRGKFAFDKSRNRLLINEQVIEAPPPSFALAGPALPLPAQQTTSDEAPLGQFGPPEAGRKSVRAAAEAPAPSRSRIRPSHEVSARHSPAEKSWRCSLGPLGCH
jgi:hypothetical protein